MATLVSSKYSLKSLHEEIGLLDRKLAHLHKFDVFANEAERDVAAAKMEHKRDLLVRQAQTMVDDGIEFQASDLPVSLRSTDATDVSSETVVESVADASLSASPVKPAKPSSPFSGTALDAEYTLKEYKQKRAKNSSAASRSTECLEVAAAN